MWTTIVSGVALAASTLSGSVAHAAAATAAPDLSGVGPLIDRTVTAQLAKDKIPGAAVETVTATRSVSITGGGG